VTSQLVSREAAGLQPRRSVSYSITPEGLTAHYGGGSPWRGADRSSRERFRDTTDHARCASIWRGWQAFHMSPGWAGTRNGGSDVAYTSAVCPHGVRFEGRGPGVRTGANGTNAGNQRSYATVYIAGDADPVTDEAKAAFLDEAARLRVPLRWDHSDWKPTACAGDPIRAWEATGWRRPFLTRPTDPPAPILPPAHPTVWNMLPEAQPERWWIHVMYLQRTLIDKAGQDLGRGGWTGRGDDGLFGPRTEAGVVNLQRFFGLTVDGIVGRQTWPIVDYIAAL
jgi:hypothetical protein